MHFRRKREIISSDHRCDLCGSDEFVSKPELTKRLTGDDPQFRVMRCRDCGLHSLNPQPTDEDLKWIYRDYAQEGNRIEVERERQEHVYPRKIDLIEKYCGSSATILDIGSGLGGFVATAQARGYSVVGVEPSEQQVEQARESFGVELTNASFEDFVRESRNLPSFDVVHMHHVLEHLRRPRYTLERIRQMMSNDAVLIAEVPNQFFCATREMNYLLGRKTRKYPSNPYHHIFFFSPKTFRTLVRKAGYAVAELNPVDTTSSFRLMVDKVLTVAGYGVASKIEVVATPH